MAVNPMVISFDGTSEPSLVFHDRNSLQIVGGARIGAARQSSQTFRVAASDFNYDFKADLATVTDEGNTYLSPGKHQLLQRRNRRHGAACPGSQSPVPGHTDIRCRSGWRHGHPVESAIVTTPPVVLRNNGDGTFKELFPFAGLRDIRHFASADADGDGDPDLAVVSAGGFTVLTNERLGQYRERPVPQITGEISAIAVADLNGDSTMDFVLLHRDGRILRLSDNPAQNDWEVAEVARIAVTPTDGTGPPLLIADLDNNGSLDIVAGFRNVLLGGAQDSPQSTFPLMFACKRFTM
jgi:hypothetical protein